MRKIALNISIIILGLLMGSCKEMEEITVTAVDGFYLNKVDAKGIDAEIKLKIKNPNAMGFSIYPSNFDIVFSGIRLGKAKLDKRVHIEGKTERVYSFKLKSDMSELNLIDALRLLNLQNLGKIEVKGDLKVGKFLIKKDFPVNYVDKIKILS